MNSPYGLTKDGHELQWQTNFLGHHALTLSLLPMMRTTAQFHPETKDRVRIVNVSSDMAILAAPEEINYADPNLSQLTGTFNQQ
jgi:retinol dehydrogenase 12